MFLMTHAYFLFYHTLSNIFLRRVEAHLSHASLLTRKVARCLVVFLLAYATAFMETLTIAHVRGPGGRRGVWGKGRGALNSIQY
jgi:cycloeucalenol cycloisomerase